MKKLVAIFMFIGVIAMAGIFYYFTRESASEFTEKPDQSSPGFFNHSIHH